MKPPMLHPARPTSLRQLLANPSNPAFAQRSARSDIPREDWYTRHMQYDALCDGPSSVRLHDGDGDGDLHSSGPGVA
jgi:hypothetical protein